MKSRSVLVGLFAVAGIVLFTLGMVLIGNRNEAFARHADYYASFVNLSGLTVGAKVQVAGMDAGQVVDIAVPSSPASPFRVELRIDDRLRGLVRTDSLATITTEGIVGDSLVLVRAGSRQAAAALPFALLPSKEPFDLTELLDRGSSLVTDVDGTLKQVSGKLDGTLDAATGTLGNVNDVVIGIKQGRGAAGTLLRDQAVAGQVRQIVANAALASSNAQLASASLAHASGQADSMVSELQSRHVPQQVEETVGHVNAAAANLDASVQQVRQTVEQATRPDAQGLALGDNVREVASQLNATSANMEEDTEALKHNLLLRGFFRKRGYFNLTDLNPNTYRDDKTFSSSANKRLWLAAASLFHKDADGTEVLSAQGMATVNTAFAADGITAAFSPVIVEGYSTLPDDKLASSRRRALVVRQYLLSHFQLDEATVGAVALGSTPPAGAGHQDWDGVCLVMVGARK